jgi:hypothetical protein
MTATTIYTAACKASKENQNEAFPLLTEAYEALVLKVTYGIVWNKSALLG